jgi:hypothetical protein
MNYNNLNVQQKSRMQYMAPDMLALVSALSNRRDAPDDLRAKAKGIVGAIKGDDLPWTRLAVEIVNEVRQDDQI